MDPSPSPRSYVLDVQEKLKGFLSDETLTQEEKKKAAKKDVKKVFEDRCVDLLSLLCPAALLAHAPIL